MIDKNAISSIVQENLELKISAVIAKLNFTQGDIQSFFRLISLFFDQIPPELIKWHIRFIIPPASWDYCEERIVHISEVNNIINSSCSIVFIKEDLLIISGYDIVFDQRETIEYFFNSPRNERLLIGRENIDLPSYYDSSISSLFYSPVYKELDAALIDYDERFARNCICGYLSQMWKDNSRLEFVDKPEHYMRDSLFGYLRTVLRNHSVKREQNVDASHPVDIKVVWQSIKNNALIEIKWLGDSGKTKYRDARANSGAKQLIDYLSSAKSEEPDKFFVGYLVVYDGRRGSKTDEYKDKDIKYNCEYMSYTNMNYYRFYLSQSSHI